MGHMLQGNLPLRVHSRLVHPPDGLSNALVSEELDNAVTVSLKAF